MKWSKILSVKYSLAVIDIVFAITGVIILSVGISTLLFYREYEELLSQRFFSLPNFLIATAVIIFLVSSLGVYAALSENFYAILAYGVLMLVVLIFEVSAGGAGFRLRADTAPEVRRALQLTMQRYGNVHDISVMWDELQAGFRCCGTNGPSDWWNASGQVPISCCHINPGQMSPMECDLGKAYSDGCAPLLGEEISRQGFIIGVSGVVLCCVQALLTAATGWLAWRSRYEEVELES